MKLVATSNVVAAK